jgi:tetratricopeptide (TPR) repeat protein
VAARATAIVAAMSARGRVFFLVTLAAVVASGVVVLGVVATRDHVADAQKPRAGHPPLALDLGVRTDPEARALQQAQQLYKNKQAARAGEIFGRYRSLEARVGSALAAWPNGSIEKLQALAAEDPRSALVALHLGLAFYWTHRDGQAMTAWRAARGLQPDTFYAVRANDLLHPQYAPGLPGFVPSFAMPLRIRVLAPARKLPALKEAAARGGAHAKILYGTVLQQLGHPLSAERQFAAAARLAPNDPDARAAAAVGLFDKDNPSRAFGRLGPLVRVFRHAQTVRFHLGLMLVWSAQVEAARKQFRLAEAEAPKSLLGTRATAFLAALRGVGTR